MFDPIKSHIDPYRGPAMGHSGGEHGDTWPDAVAKINKGFEAIVDWIKSFDPDVQQKAEPALTIEEVENIAKAKIEELRAEIMTELDSINARIAAMEGFFASRPRANAAPQGVLDTGGAPDTAATAEATQS